MNTNTSPMHRRAWATTMLRIVPEAQRARFLTLWNQIAGQQLGATLQNLAPPKDVGLFPVTIGVRST